MKPRNTGLSAVGASKEQVILLSSMIGDTEMFDLTSIVAVLIAMPFFIVAAIFAAVFLW